MEISQKLAGLAKRHTSALAGGEFESLVRAIGESKSKSEEDSIVERMISISKQQIKEGLPRKGDNTKALKDLLVYLIYIDMLGHDTSWAAAAAIQLCSHKSLVVKKAAYLATSLLIDPSSELTIMVTATIQADLRSDNFLIVCTALQAISRCTGPELVSVFLPQVLAALRHDRDHVKKKALLALHRLLQLDATIAPDVERHLVDKLGYKEPSVMVAALCGLHELARSNPAPYRNLVHYFINILKQAAAGKLGRGWDYHRAPAPFVQIELLRLLALLGADDPESSSNMHAVVVEVWRRADALASTVGNAIMYECVRTATAIHSSDALLSMALQTAQRFLHSKENNIRYSGIDILSRLVGGDPGRVEQHQLAIVDCLRSPDVTLKRKTLELLFKMAGPGNVEVIADEVLAYLKEGGDDDGPRKLAAAQLVTVAEKFAPSDVWFVELLMSLLEESSSVAPDTAADALLRVISEGGSSSSSEDFNVEQNDVAKQAAKNFLGLLEKPKLPAVLLRVACWVLGEFGLQSGQPFEVVVDKLVVVMETQAVDEHVQAAVVMALGKLSVSAQRQLPSDAAAVLESCSRSESLEVQQGAAEMMVLLKSSAATRHAALSKNNKISIINSAVDPTLQCLDGYVEAAERAGAPPYLSLEDRVAMGVTRNPHNHHVLLSPGGGGGGGGHSPYSSSHHHISSSGPLKFQAYELGTTPTKPTILTSPTPTPPAAAAASTTTTTTTATTASLFDDLDLGGLVVSEAQRQQPQQQQPQQQQPQQQQQQQVQEQLKVNKAGGRRWGPSAAAAAPAIASLNPSPPSASSSLTSTTTTPPPYSQRPSPRGGSAAPVVDPAQQRLAASLFGGGGGGGSASKSKSSASSKMHGNGARNRPAAAAAPEVDLLGDVLNSDDTPFTAAAAADLFGFDVAGGTPTTPSPARLSTQTNGGGGGRGNDAMAVLGGLDLMSGFGSPSGASSFSLLGGGGGMASPSRQGGNSSGSAQQPPQPPSDPFASLL